MAEIIFSNRSGMSYTELANYLCRLREGAGTAINWDVVNPERVRSFPPGRRMGLQIADAVAGSFYYSVQQSQYGFTEPRYAQMLKPVVYRGNSGWLGYGLNFWPEDQAALLQEEGLRWVNDVYT